MVNTEFSLAERLIINPVLQMRAELLNDPEVPRRTSEKVKHFLEAEILARVTAIFTSVFALSDAIIHFCTGCCKGGAYILLERCCKVAVPFGPIETYEHFRAAAFFSGIALVGSVAGTIWPGVFKHFKLSPKEYFKEGDNINNILPGTIYNLSNAVQSGDEKAPFDGLKSVWRGSNLFNKHWFVQIFNYDAKNFDKVRQELSDDVYRPIASSTLSKKHLLWLNENEISNVVDRSWEKTNTFSKGFFFHATSDKALESIFKAKKVEVRHEKAYRGAFVSTRPEIGFGSCILVFKRSIERLSALEHGFTINQNTYWAGFSKDIPVSESTLAYIILQSGSEEERHALENRCTHWANRKIEVILFDEVCQKLNRIEKLQMGIPKEWPEEGELLGLKILNAMKLTAALPQKDATKQQQAYTSLQTQQKQLAMAY